MFHDPDGCRDDWVRSHKDGSMEQKRPNTKIAGIDVGKAHLDAAVHGMEDLARVTNAPAGHRGDAPQALALIEGRGRGGHGRHRL